MRTLLKIVLLVALIGAAVYYGGGKKLVAKGKTAIQRSGEAHGAPVTEP